MTMIERVARALCVANSHDPDAHFQDATLWRLFIPLARAAIEAMEPTEAMVNAGFLSTDAFMAEGPEGVAKVWSAMKAAALEGEG